ncbi:MAG: ABC transporter permease [Cyclobacteriaceae bacterium]|nr:ABC transporter permease [Cyclobacteriaceae bacterium]
MKEASTPPKLATRFFRWYCHPKLRDYIEGDLMEVYERRLKTSGKRKADLLFIVDVLLLCRPGIIKPTEGYKKLNTYGMYKSYFKIGWRNLAGNKTLAFIKIFGLSIGLSACMLIFLYAKDEMSYDQFHENKTRLYRIIQTFHIGDKPPKTLGTTNTVVGETFARQLPEVQQYVRINGFPVTIKKDDEVFTEHTLFVDNIFFSVFTFPLLAGNESTALKELHSVVISKDMALKYFGMVDVIGKSLQIKMGDGFEDFSISAVSENFPQNSTLKTGVLLPFESYERYNDNKEWFGGSMNTFLLLSPQANSNTVVSKMQAIFDKNISNEITKAKEKLGVDVSITLALQPLTDIHLSTQAGPGNGMTDGSKPVYSYILTCIAVFILVIACINFINLSIAQSLKRNKEIGIRKVIGSTRKQIIRQFLTESFLVSAVAFIISVSLTLLTLPFFNELANKKLSLSYLSDGYLYAGFFLLLLVTAFFTGFYPSLVLSAFQPVKALYSREKLTGKNYLTKGLIVLQFALAAFLIIGTIAVNSQMNFLSHADLGYDSKNLVRIDIPVSRSSNRLPELFKNELNGKPGIVNVAGKNGGRSTTSVRVDGKNIIIEKSKVNESFLPVFGIPVLAGRNFSPDFPSDSLYSVIVNERFVKEAGWSLNTAVGKTVNYLDDTKPAVTVVGVIKDYHFTSLKEKITPQLFTMEPAFNYGQIWVKITPDNIPGTLTLLHHTYAKLVPYFPYTYHFMDDLNARNYETEARWKQIITFASGLFIVISCMGLFGLVMLSAGQRTKEIGIRKVLGASVSKIIMMLSKEFIVLIFIAFAVAIPIGYYFTNEWLQGFAYRINMSWWMFFSGGALVMSIALLTMSYQAMKAAMSNPVDSLRSE